MRMLGPDVVLNVNIGQNKANGEPTTLNKFCYN